jgi:hypothetical protein
MSDIIEALRVTAFLFRKAGAPPPKIELDAVTGQRLTTEWFDRLRLSGDAEEPKRDGWNPAPGEIFGLDIRWPTGRCAT